MIVIACCDLNGLVQSVAACLHLQAKYLRKIKREEVLKEKRSHGSAGSPPFLVVSTPKYKSVL